MPTNWLAFDRIRAMARSGRVFQSERVYQDQTNLDRLTAGGEFLDFNQQAAILDQTNLQINRLERYKDFDQMAQTGEISLALDLYADETCCAGDTRIPLLDGTYPTIAELAARGQDARFWIYSYDLKTNRYIPAIAHGARITGENVAIVKVTLDNGTIIRCTKNHLFMLRDGQYAEAGQLQPGQRLKPLYKQIRYRGKFHAGYLNEQPYPTANAYEFMFNGANFVSTHRWVYNHLGETFNPEIVHHQDFNSTNNLPINLKGMTDTEHRVIHCRFGADNSSFNQITLAEIELMVRNWQGPMTVDAICAACDIGKRVLSRVLKDANLTWSMFRDCYGRCSCCNERITGSRWVCKSCRRKYLADHHQLHKDDPEYRARRNTYKRNAYKTVLTRVCQYCELSKPVSQFEKNKCAYSPYCNDCRPIACQKRYINKSFGNHTVVSVEDDGIVDKVYDIEVPNYHCFAAGDDKGWVIIHNSMVDPERKHTLIIRARNRRLKRELEELYYGTLQWDTTCRPAARYLCKFGDMPFEIVLDANRSSVSSLKFMNVYNFTRIETRNGDLVGFFYMDAIWPRPIFLHPWQVMHLRLTSFENIYNPYGMSILEGGRKAFKQLRLMEDAALIYRITRSPEKRKFTIPVGLIPPKEVPEYMQMIARNFKRQRFYNPTSGTFDERYSPLIQEDDFFLPRRPDGTGPDIEVLPGGENVDKIADIEYFKKKMIAPLKIPFARVGIGEGSGASSEKSLSQSHAEFAKAVQWVQREIAIGLTKVGIVHLSLRGYSIEDIRGFEVALTATSAMEELYRIETWQTRVGVMADLKDLGWFPKEWIVTHFTDLSPDEIEQIKELETEANSVEGSSPGGGGGGLDVPEDTADGPQELLDMAGGDENADQSGDGSMPPPAEPALEGLDYAAQRRLISEMRTNNRTKAAMSIVRKWADRLGKSYDRDQVDYHSGVDALIESKQLDGLSKTPSDNVEMIHDPNSDSGLIVEWSVDAEERLNVINEVLDVITAGRASAENVESDMITAADLPSVAVSDL